MKINKKAAAAVLFITLLLSVTGCGVADWELTPYNTAAKISSPGDSDVAENSRFSMTWDDAYKRILLTEKSSGLQWSTTPASALIPRLDENEMPLPTNPQLNSPLVIEYFEPVTLALQTTSAYVGSITEEAVDVKLIKNGIRATYYFPDIQIAVPVEYTLRQEGLAISVDPAEVQENENKISRIIFAPFMCGADHEGGDGYVFVPSGSGALIEAKERGIIPVTYSQEVFGDDANRQKEYRQNTTNTENVRLPVFGSRDGDTGVFAIIESGAEAASIEVSAGSSTIGFTGVTASFALRGYQWIAVKGKGEFNRKFSDGKASEVFTVAYFPLKGNEAEYSGMAKIYRNYLFGNKAPSAEASVMGLQLLGGVMLQKSFLGIPYSSFHSLTTTKQAEDIINELTKETGYTPAVNLSGFGSSGLDIGEIGGGFTVNGKLGGKSGMKSLAAYCAENNTPLYLDYELTYFNKSGSGAKKALDIHGKTTNQYYYLMWARTRNYNFDKFFLLSRSLLSDVTGKAAKSAESLGLTGIGLQSLSTVCYSDYSDRKYFVKGGTADAVSAVIADYKARGINTAVNGGNVYAAAEASIIFDTPTQSAKYELFDEDIPFYSMAFKGYVPMTATPVNLAVNFTKSLLRSVESGAVPSFMLAAEYNTALIESSQKGLFAVDYSDNRGFIINTMKQYGEYFEAISGAAINYHTILENGLRRTIFDNGVSVLVNYTEKELSAGEVTIAANSFEIEVKR